MFSEEFSWNSQKKDSVLILHIWKAALKHVGLLKSFPWLYPIQIFSPENKQVTPYGPKQDQNKWGQNKLIRPKVSTLRHIQEVGDCNRFCGKSIVFMNLRIERRNWNNKTYKWFIIFNFINPGTFKKITLLAVNLLYFTFAVSHHRLVFITWGVDYWGFRKEHESC